MYNHKLDTFCQAATSLSFSKAAEVLFITPSAVIQQMNHLEKELGVKLFNRSRQGISLTEAGQLLLRECPGFIAQSQRIVRDLLALNRDTPYPVHVAVNSFHPVRLLFDLWQKFYASQPRYELLTHTVDNDKPIAELPGMDLVEGVCFQEEWQKDFSFLSLMTTALCLAVPSRHPLARTKLLHEKDLVGQTIMIIQRGVDAMTDALSDHLAERGAHMVEVERYSVDAVLQCVTENYALLLPDCWQYMHPNLHIIPIDWSYALPYGFFLRRNAAEDIQPFFDFLQNVSQQGRD